MIRPGALIRYMLQSKKHLWIDVFWIRETPKAILIIFDGREAWIPKAWIQRIKHKKDHGVIVSPTELGEAISIKISEYQWVKKFS